MSTLAPPSQGKPAGYRAGAIALFLMAGTIIAALGFEYLGGYVPCPLCLQQRWAYYAGVPLLFLALVLLVSESPRLATLLFFIVSLAFLANAGLGVYQSGAEWKFWPGPDTCGGSQAITDNAADLLGTLQQTNVVRCDEAAWRFAGLSFAGWNALISLAIFTLCVMAAGASARSK